MQEHHASLNESHKSTIVSDNVPIFGGSTKKVTEK